MECPSCARVVSAPNGIIQFFVGSTLQSDHFDPIYAAGQGQKDFQASRSSPWETCIPEAARYLKLCGFDAEHFPTGISLLDIACGSGRIAAGTWLNPAIAGWRIHASDISTTGLKRLSAHIASTKSLNWMEMSVQNAEAMVFGEESFDVIVGSSMLHHLNDYESFLRNCRRILKPGGVAVFGEPFAVGYGIAAGVLKLASQKLGLTHPSIDAFVNDVQIRIRADRKLLASLVDKHLFLHSVLADAARQAGFSQVSFTSPHGRDFRPEAHMLEILREQGIHSVELAEEAARIYKTLFEVFDSETHAMTLMTFLHVVLRA